jgi:DNA transformation protein and related proteins
LSVSEEFLDYLRDQLGSLGEVTLKRMFGGAGVFLNGKVFGIISDDTLYFKVDDYNRVLYEKAGAQQFKPFPHKEMLMPYYRVPDCVLEDAEDLCLWAHSSIEIPEKVRNGKR